MSAGSGVVALITLVTAQLDGTVATTQPTVLPHGFLVWLSPRAVPHIVGTKGMSYINAIIESVVTQTIL